MLFCLIIMLAILVFWPQITVYSYLCLYGDAGLCSVKEIIKKQTTIVIV